MRYEKYALAVPFSHEIMLLIDVLKAARDQHVATDMLIRECGVREPDQDSYFDHCRKVFSALEPEVKAAGLPHDDTTFDALLRAQIAEQLRQTPIRDLRAQYVFHPHVPGGILKAEDMNALDAHEQALLRDIPMTGAGQIHFQLEQHPSDEKFDLVAEVDGKRYATGIGFASSSMFDARRKAFDDYALGCQRPLKVVYAISRPVAIAPREMEIYGQFNAEKFAKVRDAINLGKIDTLYLVGQSVCVGWNVRSHRLVQFAALDTDPTSPEALQASSRVSGLPLHEEGRVRRPKITLPCA